MKNKIYTGIVVALFVILAVFLVLIAVTTVKNLRGDESGNESEISQTLSEVPEISLPEVSEETSAPGNTDTSEPEVSEPEESKHELSKEEILALLEQDIANTKAALEKGYSLNYNGNEITFYEKDLSMCLKVHGNVFNFENGKISISAKTADGYATYEVQQVSYKDFYPFVETTLYELETSVRQHINVVYGDGIRMTYSDGAYYFSGDCVYNGYEATVSGRIILTDNDMTVKCTYTYTDANNKIRRSEFSQTIDTNKRPVANVIEPVRKQEFANIEALHDYYEKIDKAFDSVAKLAKYPLNKNITIDQNSVDSEGNTEYWIKKLVAVGSETEYTVAERTEYEKLTGDIYYSKTYTYTTESGYDRRWIYKAHGYTTPDQKPVSKDYTSSKSESKSFAEQFRYANLFDGDIYFQDIQIGSQYYTSDFVQLAVNASTKLEKVDQISFTKNTDGTVTASISVARNWLEMILFNELGEGPSQWISAVNNDADLEQKMLLTYDPETGMLTALTFNCEADGKDGFWYKHSFELTVTDADESMLPEKEELLAGNWN